MFTIKIITEVKLLLKFVRLYVKNSSEGSSQMQTYYVSMLISNPRSDSIEVKYQYFNKTEGTKQLASKQKLNIDYMATLSTRPSEITVYAVKAGTNSIVFLNNKSEISITPSTDKEIIFLVSGSEENGTYFFDFCF